MQKEAAKLVEMFQPMQVVCALSVMALFMGMYSVRIVIYQVMICEELENFFFFTPYSYDYVKWDGFDYVVGSCYMTLKLCCNAWLLQGMYWSYRCPICVRIITLLDIYNFCDASYYKAYSWPILQVLRLFWQMVMCLTC